MYSVLSVIYLTCMPLFPAVVTLVCGWMRIYTWVAAAPATPSITVASQKPTTSESWSWRCGRSAEDAEWSRSFSLTLWLTSSPAQLYQDSIYHWAKTNTAAHSFHGNVHVKKKKNEKKINHKLLDLSVWLSAVDLSELKWPEKGWSRASWGWLIPVGLATRLEFDWSE